jgi:hypothetical protein
LIIHRFSFFAACCSFYEYEILARKVLAYKHPSHNIIVVYFNHSLLSISYTNFFFCVCVTKLIIGMKIRRMTMGKMMMKRKKMKKRQKQVRISQILIGIVL